jgi:hypothetical protein
MSFSNTRGKEVEETRHYGIDDCDKEEREVYFGEYAFYFYVEVRVVVMD